MKPSRIVKSAYARAVKAGFKGSLKQWARANTFTHADVAGGTIGVSHVWRTNKAEQRKRSVSRRANKGHTDVHTAAMTRSTYHASGSALRER